MIGAAQNTRLAAAGDLCRFLRFLHESRGGKSWRDAQEDDHAAFLHWREGRHTAMLDGYRPCDPMVRVFTYQADPAGRPPEEIAEVAFDTFNDHPRNPEGEELSRRRPGRLGAGHRPAGRGPHRRARHPPAPAARPSPG